MIARVRSAASKAVRELAFAGTTYRGSVVIHLYRGCEREGYTTWGPHAHVLSPGIDARRTEEYSRRTGVVVKQVTHPGSGRWVNYRGRVLYRHLVYELGHAAIVPGGHALTWLGDLKGWKDVGEDEPLPARICPECSGPLAPWWSKSPGRKHSHPVGDLKGDLLYVGLDRRLVYRVRRYLDIGDGGPLRRLGQHQFEDVT